MDPMQSSQLFCFEHQPCFGACLLLSLPYTGVSVGFVLIPESVGGHFPTIYRV